MERYFFVRHGLLNQNLEECTSFDHDIVSVYSSITWLHKYSGGVIVV